MKKNLITALGIVALVLVLATGCKKDEKADQTYYLTGLADSAGVDIATFDYDADNKLIRFGQGANSGYNFYYSGDKLIVRTNVSSGSISDVDSFFYDASNRIVRVENYNGSNTKEKTVTFAYNGDNTINSATEDYVDPLTNDMLHEYTYSGGNTSKRKTSEKVLGTYKLHYEVEFLGLDDKKNPFEPVYKKYLSDVFGLFYFVWSGAHNPTSGKQTEYDMTTGNVIDVVSVTSVYEYNADNVPTRATHSQGATSNIYTFKYMVK